MGCGSSQVNQGSVPEDQRPYDKPRENGAVPATKRVSSTDSNGNRQDKKSDNPVPKSIAFTVDIDGKETNHALLGPPPPRLKRLDPLGVPTLTAEQLAEKQRIADEKRDAELQRKQSLSVKSSRRRLQILEAQKFDQQLQQKQTQEKIEESLASAGKSREKKLTNIQEKQKLREERATRAREKVKRLNNLDTDLDLDMEPDNDYNADDVDSWLDGDNNNTKNNQSDSNSTDSGEKIYGGRSSPKKRFHEDNQLKRGISANTVDSFDNAFNRKPPSGKRLPTVDGQDTERDDFFDS